MCSCIVDCILGYPLHSRRASSSALLVDGGAACLFGACVGIILAHAHWQGEEMAQTVAQATREVSRSPSRRSPELRHGHDGGSDDRAGGSGERTLVQASNFGAENPAQTTVYDTAHAVHAANGASEGSLSSSMPRRPVAKLQPLPPISIDKTAGMSFSPAAPARLLPEHAGATSPSPRPHQSIPREQAALSQDDVDDGANTTFSKFSLRGELPCKSSTWVLCKKTIFSKPGNPY